MATLAANASATQERLKVSAIPAGDYFQIDDEIVRVIDKRTTQLTILVERAYAGTTAATHSSGAELTPLYVPSTGGGGGGESLVQQASVTLTDAQIKALPTTEFQIIAAPGADKVIIPLFALFRPTISVAYTGIDADAQLYLVSSSWLTTIYNENLNDVSQLLGGSIWSFMGPNLGVDAGGFLLSSQTGEESNLPINLGASNGSDFTGGNAANTLTVVVLYVVVDL